MRVLINVSLSQLSLYGNISLIFVTNFPPDKRHLHIGFPPFPILDLALGFGSRFPLYSFVLTAPPPSSSSPDLMPHVSCLRMHTKTYPPQNEDHSDPGVCIIPGRINLLDCGKMGWKMEGRGKG